MTNKGSKNERQKTAKKRSAMQKRLSSCFHILKKRTSFFRQPEITRFQKTSKKHPKNWPQKTAKKQQREPPYCNLAVH